jgi:hypothetical protein
MCAIYNSTAGVIKAQTAQHKPSPPYNQACLTVAYKDKPDWVGASESCGEETVVAWAGRMQ